jgi:hypothetical protein
MKKIITSICTLCCLLAAFDGVAQNIPVLDDGAPSIDYLKDEKILIKYNTGTDFFTADQLLPRIHEEFQGALLVCNPYCDVISQKLGDEWKPALLEILITSQNIKVVDVDDPLYKILFPEKVQEAKKASAKRAQNRRDRKELKSRAEKGLARNRARKKYEKENPPPKSAFENGYRYYIGGRYELLSQKTNSETVQSEFNPKSGLMNFHLGFGYFRGKPIPLWKYWTQPELGYEMDIFALKAKNKADSELEIRRTKMFLQSWFKAQKFSWAPRVAKNKYSYNVSENALTAFSFSEDVTFFGVAIKYKRYRFDIDYGFGYKLEEEQPFRDKLTKSNQMSFEGMYCQPRKSYKGTRFTPCFGGQLMLTSNDATFKPEINPTGSVALDRQELVLFYNIYFGEDFLR